jgi:hypothetical protein
VAYADTLLAPGEHVVHRSHQHWLSLVLDSRLAIALWAVTIVLLAINIVFRITGGAGTVLGYLMAITFVLGVIVVAIRFWIWRNEEYLITSRRLLNVSGIINKRSADSSLEKINDAILEENLVGRMLDYGDLAILTASDVAIDRYRMLSRAKEFKRHILEAKHALETGVGYRDVAQPGTTAGTPGTAVPGAPTPAAAAAPTVAAAAPLADPVDTAAEVTAALGRLAELRDKGAITVSDYEIKKRELLGRL